MSNFKDREKSFENKFAHDQEMQFRVTARRNRLLGEWAAGLMGLTAEETDAYAKAVVQADFEESDAPFPAAHQESIWRSGSDHREISHKLCRHFPR